MVTINRILCAIDFSEHSRRALDHAAAIARWYEASITALYVFSLAPMAAVGPGATVLDPIVLTDADLEQLRDDVRAFAGSEMATGVVLDAEVRQGFPAGEIDAYAREISADLIVLGTHGRSGVERLVLGSVAERVMRRAPCPVLTVPAGQPDAVPAGGPLFKRIVCPIDFSEPSLLALEYALSMARESDGCLTILHVAALSIAPPLFEVADPQMSLEEFRRRTMADLEVRLRATVPADANDYCQIDTMLTTGHVGKEVVRVAGESQADLIVIGVRGRGAIDLTVFGSTAQHVVRAASCPVLTIRQIG
jgi:nucleotide-binding universal stress UspA family protein